MGEVKCSLCLVLLHVQHGCLLDPRAGVIRSHILCHSLFAFSRISIASFARWSTYPEVLSNIEVRLKSRRRPALMLHFCRRRIYGLIRIKRIWCSLQLASIVLPLCPTHNPQHSDIHPVCGLCLIFECWQH
jgi:hypothetical protein